MNPTILHTVTNAHNVIASFITLLMQHCLEQCKEESNDLQREFSAFKLLTIAATGISLVAGAKKKWRSQILETTSQPKEILSSNSNYIPHVKQQQGTSIAKKKS